MATKAGDVHVSPTGDDRWQLTQDGQQLSTHGTQANAAAHGEKAAKRDGVDLVIHGRDGKIRSKDSLGNDPIPPRDREH